MKRACKRVSSLLFAAFLLIYLAIPMTAFAIKATSAKVMFDTTETVLSVYLEMQNGTQKSILMQDQGNHWTIKDNAQDVEGKLLGVTIVYAASPAPISIFYPSTVLNTTAEGSGGSGSIVIRLGDIALQQSTLTVNYLLDGTSAVLHPADTFTQYVGTSVSVPSAVIEGYTLKSGQTDPYLHAFTASNASYTFWYVANPAPGALTVTANSNSKTYDGTALTDSGYTLTGTLASGDVISVEVTGTITNAGTADNTVGAVTIRQGQDGPDVTANYTITKVNGSLTVNPVALTITADSNSKTYDGTALTDSGYAITSGAFVGDDGFASVTVTGSQTEVGSSANTITAYTLNSGTIAGNYTITALPGTLTVTAKQVLIPLTITADSNSKTYNGTALTDSGYSLTGTLASGDVISVEVTGTITNAGTADNTVGAVTIRQGQDGPDVTANYTITKVNGSLTVNPVALTITADSNSKTYDGTALTDSGYAVTSGAFVGDDGFASVTVTGSQTEVGSSANTITAYTLNSGTIAGNYTITALPGTLTVTAKQVLIPLTITADSNSKAYDGTALTDSGYTFTGTLASGDIISAEVTGTITNAGTADNTVGAVTIRQGQDGPDVTANYTITKVNGSLTVNPVALTVTADSNSKMYDGTALTDSGYAVTSGAFVGDDGFASVTVTGSQTEVGSSANTITAYTLNSGTIAGNYTITALPGTLTVTTPYTPSSPSSDDTYSTLLVKYLVDGSDPAIYLKADDSYTRIAGTSLTVTAPSFEGYVLKEGEDSSYTHTFTASNAEYVFLYQEEMIVSEPEPPLAEPEVEVPAQEPPLAELPKTGGIPYEFFYAAGVAMVTAGLLTGKKKNKQ